MKGYLLTSLVLAALFPGGSDARAQLYVSRPTTGAIADYDPETGALLHATLVPGLANPRGIAIADGDLYVADYARGTVAKFDAATGAEIAAPLLNGLTWPQAVAVSGSDLYVASFDRSNSGLIGKYNALNGDTINRRLVSLIKCPLGLAVADNKIYVSYGDVFGCIAEYDATTGACLNPMLVSQVNQPMDLLLSGNELFVTTEGGTVYKYDATTGANVRSMSRPFIFENIQAGALAISGDTLYVASSQTGIIAKYDAATGIPLSSSFITGLAQDIGGLAIVPAPRSTASAYLEAFVTIREDFFWLLIVGAFNRHYLILLPLAFLFVYVVARWLFLFFEKRLAATPLETVAVEKPPDAPLETTPIAPETPSVALALAVETASPAESAVPAPASPPTPPPETKSHFLILGLAFGALLLAGYLTYLYLSTYFLSKFAEFF